jgi:hypothetical protein
VPPPEKAMAVPHLSPVVFFLNSGLITVTQWTVRELGHLQRGDTNERVRLFVLNRLGGCVDIWIAASIRVSVWVACYAQHTDAAQMLKKLNKGKKIKLEFIKLSPISGNFYTKENPI